MWVPARPWAQQPDGRILTHSLTHSGQDECQVEYISVSWKSRTEAPISPMALPSLPDPVSPALCPASPTDHLHLLPSITPKGKLWQEKAGPQSFPSSPKDFGGGQRAQQGETKQRIKVCDCQCQEKLNNPVTSMKVNSRSAAHREYECLQDSEYNSGVCPPRWAAFSPGTRRRREEATHFPPPGREQLPRISHQAWGWGEGGGDSSVA